MSGNKADRRKRRWKGFWRFIDKKIANLAANGSPERAERERQRWTDRSKRPWLKALVGDTGDKT